MTILVLRKPTIHPTLPRSYGSAKIPCPIHTHYTCCDSLENLLRHAKDLRSLKEDEYDTFLVKVIIDEACTFFGCGIRLETFLESLSTWKVSTAGLENND